MIEQTEMVVTKWQMNPSEKAVDIKNVTNHTTLEVMRKRNAIKKGIACRLTCRFMLADVPVLDYSAEHSYVIDLDEVIDRTELANMIRNSFAQFNEKFEFRKLGTLLHDEGLVPLDENNLDLDSILPLLV
ncbi:MAG: hypothetical protein IPG38_13610 [Chitinophagaceae bacterium]|nr:hypothetical protein [Chitinophagaceae bacterium]MBK9530540.1 hypothetical protein [Chitinophagaceae bacterium]